LKVESVKFKGEGMMAMPYNPSLYTIHFTPYTKKKTTKFIFETI